MSKDDIYEQRDKLLTEIHKSVITTEAVVCHLRERVEETKQDLKAHEQKDEKLQGWILKIGVVVLIIVAANGGMEFLKSLFKVVPIPP